MAYQVVNPATGKLESEYPTATDAEISDVLGRAEQGYRSWRRTPLEERAGILRQVAQLYRDRADELAAIITREMGKITKAGLGELKFASNIYRYYAEHGAELLRDQPLDSRLPGTAWVRKSPIGALLGIMPWNYPVLPGGPVRSAEPDDREHHRAQARAAVPGVGAVHAADLPRRGVVAGRVHQRVRQQRAGRAHDRGPADRRGVGDRERAGRIGGRRRRRAASEEGGAGAGRQRPVHCAGRRRPARGGQDGGCGPDGERRPGLQRVQADDRGRGRLRRLHGASSPRPCPAT